LLPLISTRRSVRRRSVLTALPAVAVALLPKCPACLSAYAALASSLGLGFLIESAYLLPLILVVLIVAVLAHRMRKKDHRKYAAIALEAFGVSIVLAGKFLFDSRPVVLGGIACLIAGSLWSFWSWRAARGACAASVAAGAGTGSHG
jgi:hypothetical protein